MAELKSISGSGAEDLFIDLFADTFGAEKAGYYILNTLSLTYIKMQDLLILSAKVAQKELLLK